MKVDSPIWEDGVSTSWILELRYVFVFLEHHNFKVEIASVQLDGDAIQWYDWFGAGRGVSTRINLMKTYYSFWTI